MYREGQLSEFIKDEAARLGFTACGIAPAEVLSEDENRLRDWLGKGFHAKMNYMQDRAALRANPQALVENARSVVVLLYNYYPAEKMPDDSAYLVSAYAYGRDYHDVIREKLNQMISAIREREPDAAIRGFVDSAPVLERAWAARAGLGWIGKNSMLISRKQGSWFFITELITDLKLAYDTPMGGNYCGDCSRCIDACPTGAIVDAKVVDANRCISYLTIENKETIPEEFKGKYKKWIFGCDICQQVCPWNRFAMPHSEPAFVPKPEMVSLGKQEWESMEEDTYREIFRKSAVKRAKFAGLKRNIQFLAE